MYGEIKLTIICRLQNLVAILAAVRLQNLPRCKKGKEYGVSSVKDLSIICNLRDVPMGISCSQDEDLQQIQVHNYILERHLLSIFQQMKYLKTDI